MVARLRPIAGPGTRVVLIATPPQKSTGKKSSLPDAMFSAYTVRNTTRYGWIVSHIAGGGYLRAQAQRLRTSCQGKRVKKEG